ncbi:MAG TPA: hypothetical protein VIS99_14990, partial [Terrimicrobiaceae bacterium]
AAGSIHRRDNLAGMEQCPCSTLDAFHPNKIAPSHHSITLSAGQQRRRNLDAEHLRTGFPPAMFRMRTWHSAASDVRLSVGKLLR